GDCRAEHQAAAGLCSRLGALSFPARPAKAAAGAQTLTHEKTSQRREGTEQFQAAAAHHLHGQEVRQQ
ncbi:UNVERIFIED_CONTAM: hypothetical protein ODX46_13960, partial [Salmonella enterica subsp. enterica serovar Enteritidis]